MKKILVGVAAAGMLAAPALTFASTYQYVDNQGYVQTETANSWLEALTVPGIAINSGVLFVADMQFALPDLMFVGIQ